MLAYLARLALRWSCLSVALAALAFLALSPAPAQADTCTPFLAGITFPGIVNGVTINQCTTDLVINANGTVTVDHNNTPYTNSGNALIGVINNSGSAVFDLFITGFNSSSPGILQFSGADAAEVLCATSLAPRLACGNALATSGDEGITSAGGIVYFTAIGPANGANGNTGDVIFTGDLLPGQSAIFGTLQDILNAQVSPVPVPEPGSLGVLGTGVLGLGLYRFNRKRKTRLKLKPQQA
ncbi:MAG TPA: PEP-CTERM sorting domain-containing protein [Stellaceae bacterium]|nr:PEP-CTERM sorting domain-containing protein [Stellaceae bacterium]